MNNRALYLGIFATVCLVVAATVGLVLHYTLAKPQSRDRVIGNCIPEGDASEEKCESRGCNWQETDDESPFCTFPDGYGYLMEGEPEDIEYGERVKLKMISKSSGMFEGSEDITDLELHVEFFNEQTVRLKFVDPNNARFNVTSEAVKLPTPGVPDENDRLYRIEYIQEPQFGVRVIRKQGNVVVFDTSVPGFTFSDQYLHVTTKLPSSNVYGFGEHNHRQYRHDMKWKKWPIFTRDVAPVDEWNLYGAQPMYMNLEENGNANGVLLLNSDAMDVELQPDPYPAISFNVIGGILDFFVFLGPTPENVVQQYTGLTGRSAMVPYWSLGFQLSRWDYDNLTHVKTVVQRNIDADIPYDVQYGDIDYMESKLDFTFDKDKYAGLPDFVNDIRSKGMRYIIILDHCIGSNETLLQERLDDPYRPLIEGREADIFIKDPRDDSKYLEGEVWPGLVHYPDFTKMPAVTEWWTDQCVDFYYNWSVPYDALWIDMNEPSNFLPGSTTGCEDNKYNYPPYIPPILGADDEEGKKNRMFDKTICMDAQQEWGLHYDVHSLYGHSMSITTWDTLRTMFPTKRPLVLTRSNFAGTQKYAQHWLGDNQSLWEQIHWSIVGMLEYSLFGFSYTGADICGFWFATTEEMCQRWMQLGAFYPYARNHNGETWPDQDPANFSPEMIRVSRDILRTRYRLLPFLYTLMHEAHVYGNTVVRPLLHEYPTDSTTLNIDRQFLWGPSFMISPAMDQGQTVVRAYVPAGRWYDYYGGKEVEESEQWYDLDTPLDKINLHVRGGYILPTQEPANNTVYSRMNPMGVIVALDENNKASGSLFWDDGESFETFENDECLMIQFSCEANELTITPTVEGYAPPEQLDFESIKIWGLNVGPSRITVNGNDLNHNDYIFDGYSKELHIFGQNLNIEETHTITWNLS